MILESDVPLHPLIGWRPPVVIGAIGGSGTRALTQIVSAAGVHMGTHLDAKTLDSLPIRELLTEGFEPLAGAAFAHAEALPRSLYQRLIQALELHRGTIAAGARWGWKNPRSAWLIPVLARLFPSLKFIYLVRDGRDVALSNNRFLLRSAGRFLLDAQRSTSDETAQLELWVKGTCWALAAAERHLPEGLLTVRYEDLCAAPSRTVDRILAFLEIGLGSPARDRLANLIIPSLGIGRGKDSRVFEMVPGAAETLAALQYEVMP